MRVSFDLNGKATKLIKWFATLIFSPSHSPTSVFRSVKPTLKNVWEKKRKQTYFFNFCDY